MIKQFLLWLFLVIAGLLHSQTLSIKDYETKKTLEAVTLFSVNPKAHAITNHNGQADITAFKNSERIEIRILGYKTLYKSYSYLKDVNFEIHLKASNFNLDEVVISATRWKQTSGNVPSKIISITTKDIALLNPQTAADLLNISGKVYIQKSQQGGGSPMIRGFATNRLLYTVDGIRMNNAIFRSGNIQNVINIDPFATEHTEVFFGPGSVIYGSDAIGGVMSFETLTPKFSTSEKPLIKGKAVIRSASANNEKTGHIDFNIGWKKWSLISSFSSWDFDNLRQGSVGPVDYIKPFYVKSENGVDAIIKQKNPLLQIPSAYSQINVMQKIRFKPNEDWDFQYGFHYSTTSTYGRYDRHNRMRNGKPRYAEWNYGPQSWLMNNLNITHKSNKTFYDQMTMRLALQSFDESRIDRTLNKVERNTQIEQVEAYSANLDFEKALNEKNTVFYGFEFVYNDITSTGFLTDISTNIKTTGPARYPKSNWRSLALYVNEEFKLTDKFTLQSGLRYNQIALNANFSNNIAFFPFPFTTAKIDNGSFTGSIGGVYRPKRSWVISSNIGTAFRSPNVDDLGKVFDSGPGAITIPNPNLKSEYAYNFDFGIAKVINDVIKIDVTTYYTSLKNALVLRDFQLNGQNNIVYEGELSKVQAIQNAAKAYVYGFQGGLEVKLPAGFSFLSDLNYQKGREELDNGTTSASRHAAPLFGTSRLSYKADKLNLQFYASYQAERKFKDLAAEEQVKDEIYAKDAQGKNYSPAWYTINLKSTYAFSEQITATVGLENITDQRYRPYSSGISAAGRNFVISMSAQF
ncbi:MAG: TonB-dependent receptor [Flavobacteriales bacterium CG_4_8_14_3_um_filter_35_10]|nr:TonB-dependent receptor [Zetaproteobacteria bacterium]OIO11349.1 MAG: TonB-dependent receptor [Flavobacteriaceae bacterium CG1_02_35_72]PIR12324.1 MAG: TonB-dependent receptor [Flavobacteriales bacterium CG11_big_fil_rev_8_21_14_0_20_35_7]PIX07158.1 MAG: TonB-dependent receptor [Flavobacteriales bacterium CG_4_8_14_3_um_filter_35_10]PJA04540.1 MAG: TonB-dependent receptor [Flavobacteriales bacterium CG_4_10_14_0_2_um_filter_35_18]